MLHVVVEQSKVIFKKLALIKHHRSSSETDGLLDVMDAVLEFAYKFVELPTLLVDEDRDERITLCVVKLAF